MKSQHFEIKSKFKSAVFDCYLGVDQTGAVNSKGIPRELPATLICPHNEGLSVSTNLTIDSLNRQSIQNLVVSMDQRPQSSRRKIFVCVDAALGLPQSRKISFSKLAQKAARFEHGGKKYGAKVAHEFFNSFPGENQDVRVIEKITGSNSVFNLHPFQKNIGCGTFRILKDLSGSPNSFSLWPFDSLHSELPTIAEGYPSLYWKTLLGLKKRSLEDLGKLFPHIEFTSVDSADSFVLALAGFMYHNQVLQIPPDHICRQEGWILGVPYEAVETMSFDPWKSAFRAQDFLETQNT